MFVCGHQSDDDGPFALNFCHTSSDVTEKNLIKLSDREFFFFVVIKKKNQYNFNRSQNTEKLD